MGKIPCCYEGGGSGLGYWPDPDLGSEKTSDQYPDIDLILQENLLRIRPEFPDPPKIPLLESATLFFLQVLLGNIRNNKNQKEVRTNQGRIRWRSFLNLVLKRACFISGFLSLIPLGHMAT